MDLLPSPEQAEIANSTRSFLAAEVPMTAVRASAERAGVDRWPFAYLGSFQATIAAGTRDIQRNIIGERVLGLPR